MPNTQISTVWTFSHVLQVLMPPSIFVAEHLVLYYMHKGHNQLMLPSGGGFHDTILQKPHETALGGHLGSEKTLEALQACVW